MFQTLLISFREGLEAFLIIAIAAMYLRRTGREALVSALRAGTTVAVLPASCTVVVVDGVSYHHCGDSYYVASNGSYVVVNPPR